MQNTTTSKEIPERLIENFMIAGISQEKLMKNFGDSQDDLYRLHTRMNPDILFSMYYDSIEMEKYTQFIFPNKVQIVLDEGSTEERFHSFLTTDVKGNQSFFHCFFFYEQLSKYQIQNDFNFDGPAANLQKQQVQKLKKKDRRMTRADGDQLLQNNQQSKIIQRQNRMAPKKVRRGADAGLENRKAQGNKAFAMNKNYDEQACIRVKQTAKNNHQLNSLLDEHFKDAANIKMQEEANGIVDFINQKKKNFERDKSVFMVDNSLKPEMEQSISSANPEASKPQGIKSLEVKRVEVDNMDRDSSLEFDQSNKQQQKNQPSSKSSANNIFQYSSQMVMSPPAGTTANAGQRDLGQSMVSAWKQSQMSTIKKNRKKSILNAHPVYQTNFPPSDRTSQMGAMQSAYLMPQKSQRNLDDNRATVNMMIENFDKRPNDQPKKSGVFSNSIVMSQIGEMARFGGQFYVPQVTSNYSRDNTQNFVPATANFNENPLSNLDTQYQTARFNDGPLQTSQQPYQNQQLQGQQQFINYGFGNQTHLDTTSNGGFDEDANRFASYLSHNIRQSSFKHSQINKSSFSGQFGSGRAQFINGISQTLVNADVVGEEWKKLCRKVEEVVYVPVAFVIQTKAEFHDHFKLMLMKIYESFTRQKQFSQAIESMFESQRGKKFNSVIPNLQMLMAYADLVTHVAFLRTIPAPVFNSEVNILFMNEVFHFKENKFNQLPHKNKECIDKLIDCLDFNTILKCIKALLFDRTLIVFSQEISLLFNIVEGLKQLMFPFTVDNQQFLPANNNYPNSGGLTIKDIFDEMDGIQSVIFAIQTSAECSYEIYKNYENSVVLDIDASIAFESNDQPPMPKLPNELEILRILNGLRNRMRYNYDKVYPDIQDDRNKSIQEIRHVFFCIFKKFLIPAFKSIRLEVEDPQNLNDFWNSEEFFMMLEEEDEIYQSIGMDQSPDSDKTYQNFGRQLAQSQSFVHFMDGYLDDQTLNFDVVNSILLNQKELTQRYKKKACSMSRFNLEICRTIQSMGQDEYSRLKEQNKKYSDPVVDRNAQFQDHCVYFNHALPSSKQITMLFEKIYFLNEVNRKRLVKKRGADSFVNDLKMEDAQSRLQKRIIDIIRKIYIQQDQEVVQGAERQLSIIQKQSDVESNIHQKQSNGQPKTEDNDTVLDDPEEDRDILADLQQNNSSSMVKNPTELASFASIVRQNQQYSGSIIGKNSIIGGGELYQSRHDSILEVIKNPVGNRQSDFQSARWAADPFLLASQSREATQLKHTLVVPQDMHQNLSEIEESVDFDPSSNQPSERITESSKPIAENNTDSDIAKDKTDQQQPGLGGLLAVPDNQNTLLKSHFSSFAYAGGQQALKSSYYQQAAQNNTQEDDNSNFAQQVFEKLEELQKQEGSDRINDQPLELGNSQIIEETDENASNSNNAVSRDGTAVSANVRESHNQANISGLFGQTRDQGGITFREMPPQNLRIQNKETDKQPVAVTQQRFSNLLEQKRDIAETFHDPNMFKNNEQNTYNINDSNTIKTLSEQPNLSNNQTTGMNAEQASDCNKLEESPISNKSKQNQPTDMSSQNSYAFKDLQIDSKFFFETDLITEFTTDGVLNQNGYKLQKLLQKVKKNQQLDSEEIIKLQNLKDIIDVMEFRRDNTFIYGQRGLINFLQTLFPIGFTNSERQNLNFYFTIRDCLIDYIARKQLMCQIKQIEKIKHTEQLYENKDSNLNFQKVLGDMKQDASGSIDKADAEEIKNQLNQSGKLSDQWGAQVGNLEQPERLRTFMFKNNITNAYTNDTNTQETRLFQVMASEVHDHMQYELLQSNQAVLHNTDSHVTDQEIQNRLTTLQNNMKGSPVKEQIEKAKGISDRQKLLQCLKQLEQLQSKQQEEYCWFWIEKQQDVTNPVTNQSALSAMDDLEPVHQFSYQEVLIFIKYFNNFESKNCANGMILQLIMNFPVLEMSHHKRVQWILDQDECKNQIQNQKETYDLFMTDDNREKCAQVCSRKMQIIEYIFPLSHFQCILDNMTRQQIIDFYGRLRQGKKNDQMQTVNVLDNKVIHQNQNDQTFGFHTKLFFNQHINQFNRDYLWDMPNDAQMNSALYSLQKDYRFFQNLTFFLLFIKFVEVIQLYKEDLNKDSRCTLILQEREKTGSQSVFDFEHLLDCLDERNQANSALFDFVNKRDSLSMGNRYFEIIDERIFQQCSISDYVSKRNDQIQFEKLKQIEQIIMQRNVMQEKLQAENAQNSPNTSLRRIMRSSNNSNNASCLNIEQQTSQVSSNKSFIDNLFSFNLKSTSAVGGRDNMNQTVSFDLTQTEDQSMDAKRDMKNQLSISPSPLNRLKQKESQSKPPSPRGKFFNFRNMFKANKNNDEKRERVKQAKSKEPKDKILKLLPLQSIGTDKPTGLNTTRNSRKNSDKELIKDGDKNNQDIKKQLLQNQKQSVKSHKKNLSYDVTQLSRPGYDNGNQQLSPGLKEQFQQPQDADSPGFNTNGMNSQNIEQQVSEDQIANIEQNTTTVFNITADVLADDRQSDNADKYFYDNFKRMADQPRKRGVNTIVDQVTHDPIKRSLRFLRKVLYFWLNKNNQPLLYKDQYKKYTSSAKDQEIRIKGLEELQKVQNTFQNIKVNFTEKESKAPDICSEEYAELAKQCYYINLYNAVILFKLAEIATFEPKKMFEIKNYSSWLSLEQNSRMMIGQTMYSAYQIKNDILKNLSRRKPDEYTVDTHYLHPLVDFAFFMPKHNSMKMTDLIQTFNNVENFKNSFSRLVSTWIKDKINVKHNFNLIRLPFCLKQILKVSLLKTPLEYYRDQINQEVVNQDDSSSEGNSQFINKKQQKNLTSYELQKVKQIQIVEILKHIYKYILNGKAIDYGSMNQKNKESILENIRMIIINITKALNYDKQDVRAIGNQSGEHQTGKGQKKQGVQMNQSISLYSGSQGQGSNSEQSGQSRIAMTEYFIEWITPKYGLKPEKLFDYNNLENQYNDIFKMSFSKRSEKKTPKFTKQTHI